MMRLDPAKAKRIATLVLVAFLGFLVWRLSVARGTEVDLVYDLSRVGRTDLERLQVELRRGADVERTAEFRYPPGEGQAPTQQRHRARLRDGSYQAVLTLQFRKGAPRTAVVPFTVPPPNEGPVVLKVPSSG
jgi:hypothetical protein